MDRNFKYGYLELDLEKELFYTSDSGEVITEEWEDILDYEGYYQISNCGRAKSLEREIIRSNGVKYSVNERIIGKSMDYYGYPMVSLSKEGISKSFTIHKLAAIAFLNHKPSNHIIVVDHINNVRLDNRSKNLQLITQRENLSKDRNGGTSIYVGVSLNNNSKWDAKIEINKKSIHIGSFLKEKEASKAYQEALTCIKENRIEDVKIYRSVYTSKHVGVCFNKKNSTWVSHTRINKKSKYLGSFKTEEEAHKALLNYKKQIL